MGMKERAKDVWRAKFGAVGCGGVRMLAKDSVEVKVRSLEGLEISLSCFVGEGEVKWWR